MKPPAVRGSANGGSPTRSPVAQAVPADPTAAPAAPLPPAPTAPGSRAPAWSDAEERLDDAATCTKLRDLGPSDPERSLRLAKRALERFPDSPQAPELEWNVVKSLFNMGRLQDAKDEGRRMPEAYPESSFAADVERHLLNPLPNPQ